MTSPDSAHAHAPAPTSDTAADTGADADAPVSGARDVVSFPPAPDADAENDDVSAATSR